MKRSRHARRAVFMEAVESRLMMDATYHNLAGGNFVQSWTNTGQITADDDWSGVPSIIGYRGDGLTGSTGTDPQTITTDSAVVDVNANQTSGSYATGGVTEFHLADPVVGIKGSVTARAPYIQIHLDTTGRQDIQVSYNLRDIDASANNSVQPVALQYRVGNSGTWINVPAAFIADASDGPSLTKTTAVSNILLPAAVNNQSQVQVRMITTDAVGTDEYIGIDDINIVSAPLGGAGQLAFSSATYTVNENAGTATVTVSRTNGSAGTVTVNYSTVAGGTASGSDYTATSGTLTFVNGDFEESFTVPITNDSSPERHETINLQLTTPGGGATLGAQTTAVLTIVDDDLTKTPGVLLNEIEVDPRSVVDSHEYVEIAGPANGSLQGFYFMAVSGEGVESGLAKRIVDLHSYSLGSNGLLVIRGASGHAMEDPATTVVTTASFPNSNALDNDSNSYILLYSPVDLSSYLLEYVDEDADGNLDLPAGVVLVDGLGWRDNVTTDTILNGIADLTALPYDDDPQFPLQPPLTPDAASRHAGNTTALSAAAWFWGDLSGTTGDSKPYVIGTVSGENVPYNSPGGSPRITPGAINYGPPVVTSRSYDVNGATSPKLVVDFSKNVQASLVITDDSTTSFKVTNLNTMTDLPASSFAAISYGAGDIVTLSFIGGALPDGNYLLTIVGANVKDTDNLTMNGNVTEPFYFLQGDANQDRKVNTLDFNIFAGNYGQTGRNFSQSNFNYDNIVDSQDFNVFVGHYGQTLPEVPPPASPLGGGSLFSAMSLDTDDGDGLGAQAIV